MRKMLGEFCAGLHKEGVQQKKERIQYIKGLQSEVAKMRRGFQQAQETLHQEFKKAHHIYQEFAVHAQKTYRPSAFSQPAKTSASSQQGKIMAALKENPSGMTRKELAYTMGMQEQALGQSLARMQKGGRIHKKKNLFSAA